MADATAAAATGTVERQRTTWVVKGYAKGYEKEQKEPVPITITAPKQAVAFENCKGGVFVIALDMNSAHFTGVSEEELRLAAVTMSRCEDIAVEFSGVRASLSLNNCSKVKVVVTDTAPTVELQHCKGCSIALNGKAELSAKTQVFHEDCQSTTITMPYKDKYGDNVREFALPSRILSTFASEKEMAHSVPN